MTTTTVRPIAAHQVRTQSIWAGWHSWNIRIGNSRTHVLRTQAMKDETDGLWVVSTSKDLGETERTEIARVKTLKSVREVMAWLYNREAGVADLPALEEVLETASKTARRKAEPAVSTSEAGIKVGDIFYCSWGYDQTNIDFYEVVAVKPKSVVIRPIAQDVDHEHYGHDKVTARASRYIGPAETKVVRGSAQHPYLSMTSYSSATPWKGQPVYQTAAGFGH